jgi:hypothetical protein
MKPISERLCLKFGALKSWNIDPEGDAAPIMSEYLDHFLDFRGQVSSPEQREMLCKLIDAVSTETIVGDWDGKLMSKDEAKEYVMNYSKEKTIAPSSRM